MKIFLDIETIPLGEEPVFAPTRFPGVKVPGNYRNPEAIDNFKEENFGKQSLEHEEKEKAKHEAELHEWKKGALKATRSQIVCICAIASDGRKFSHATNDEKELLGMFDYFFNDVVYDQFIGHNIESFDIPMIRTHAVKFGFKDLKDQFTFPVFPRDTIKDTMFLWDKKNWTKLTEIAEFLGIGNLNGDTDGSDIYDLYKAGKFAEIETKCMNDVLMCKEVYERIF